MDVLARLDATRAAINVLEHPFYQRWSAGELSADELARYADEYRHAVCALAHASTRAAELAADSTGTAATQAEGLRRHAHEETAHIALWEEFERATAARGAKPADGGDVPDGGDVRDRAHARPLAQTQACVRAWAAGEDLLEHLAVLYAIEAGQPEVSATKLEGLTEHYGYSHEGPAAEYFRVHELRDVEHAREARELIARLMAEVEDPQEQGERMLVRAREALQGNWLLLDGVEGR